MTLSYKKRMPLASLYFTEHHVEQQFNVTNVRFGSEAAMTRRKGRSCALECHVQRAKMHKRAEDDGKQRGVDQCVHETVVEFDKAPGRVEYKYDDRGDKDWL
jgi:hypothetical protein